MAPTLFSKFIPNILPRAIESELSEYAAQDQKLQRELIQNGFTRQVFVSFHDKKLSISLGQFGLVGEGLRFLEWKHLPTDRASAEVVSSLFVKVLKLGFDFMGAALK